MATVLSGARAKLIVNGVEVGYASNVSATENIALARVDVLGDIEVQVCRCGTVGALADLWIAAREDVAKLSSGAKKRAWTIVGQRATAIGSARCFVSCPAPAWWSSPRRRVARWQWRGDCEV